MKTRLMLVYCYMYVRTYVCMYIYIYTHTNIHTYVSPPTEVDVSPPAGPESESESQAQLVSGRPSEFNFSDHFCHHNGRIKAFFFSLDSERVGGVSMLLHVCTYVRMYVCIYTLHTYIEYNTIQYNT